jgi:hypothetical protein
MQFSFTNYLSQCLDNGDCVRSMIDIVPEFTQCQEAQLNYDAVSGQCMASTQVALIKECPLGYTMSGTQCAQNSGVQYPPQLICP